MPEGYSESDGLLKRLSRPFLAWPINLLKRSASMLRPVRSSWLIIKRMRFSWLFAAVTCLALLSDQGQEILATSFDSLFSGSLFAACALLAAGSVWYTNRFLVQTWSFDPEVVSATGWLEDVLVEWVPRLLGALVLAIPGIAVFFLADLMIDPAGAAYAGTVLLTLSLVFLVATYGRRKWLNRTFAAQGENSESTRVSQQMRWFLTGSLFFSAVLVIAQMVYPMLTAKLHVSAGVVVMLAAAMLAVSGSLVVYVSDAAKFPLLGVILLAATIFSLWNDNHREIFQAKPVAGAERFALDEYLKDRISPLIEDAQQRCKEGDVAACQEKVPVVVVAAEGGGVRAAAWTSLVLSRLEKARQPSGGSRFHDRVVAISGVSGGTLGAAAYLAALRDSGPRAIERPRSFYESDLLTPLLSNMMFVDAPLRLIPFEVPNSWIADRGVVFERTVQRAWANTAGVDELNAFSQPFESLWDTPFQNLPLLLANTTVVGTGERMIQSPLAIEPGKFQAAFPGAVDASTCWKQGRLSLAAAVHNSARFTWVSPAGRFDDDSGCPGVRVVDGGYFENSGTATATDIIVAARGLFGRKIRPIVVQIRNDPIPVEGFKPTCDSGKENGDAPGENVRKGPRVALSEVFDPLFALANGRVARADQAKAALRRLICGYDWGGEMFEFALFKDGLARFPLHWTISRQTLRAMDDQLENSRLPNAATFKALLASLSATKTKAVVEDEQDPLLSLGSSPGPNASRQCAQVEHADQRVDAQDSARSRAARAPVFKEVQGFSESVRALCVAVLGGSILLVFGMQLRTPKSLSMRAMYLLLAPAWICLASSIRESFLVGQHYLAIIVPASPRAEDLPEIEKEINLAMANQIDYAMYSFGLFAVWILVYLAWWIIGYKSEEE